MKSDRNLNGYLLVYRPNHPSAMKNETWLGYVYEHILVAETNLGRSLRKDECVHHLDGNKSNNRDNNLLILLKSEHKRLHRWLNRGAPYEKSHNTYRKNSENSGCIHCGRALQHGQEKFCSHDCRAHHQRKVERPDFQTLMKEISTLGYRKTGIKYGVSDHSIRKWVNRYNRETTEY